MQLADTPDRREGYIGFEKEINESLGVQDLDDDASDATQTCGLEAYG